MALTAAEAQLGNTTHMDGALLGLEASLHPTMWAEELQLAAV